MPNIFPVPPSLDVKTIVNDFIAKSNITLFNLYEVGLTDVEEKYIDWKYTNNYRFKTYYRDLYNPNDAMETYERFKELGFKDLGYDAVDEANDTITKVFIVRIPSN